MLANHQNAQKVASSVALSRDLYELGASGRSVTRQIRSSYVLESRLKAVDEGYPVDMLPDAKEYVGWISRGGDFPRSLPVLAKWRWRPLISSRLASAPRKAAWKDLFVVDEFLAEQLDAFDEELTRIVISEKRLELGVCAGVPAALKLAMNDWRVTFSYGKHQSSGDRVYISPLVQTPQSWIAD